MRIQRTHRPAFTIVEMMVAMALILFIMAVIAQTFGSASKTYTELRAAGDLQERLRLGSSVIRKDLTLEHFDGPYVPGRNGPRVGDQRLDLAGWVPPWKGYFEIRQYSPSVLEPLSFTTSFSDPEGLTSTRSDSHVLRFTSKLPELPAAELFCAAAPAGTPGNAFPVPGQNVYYSRWAEIMYFLAPTSEVTPPNASGVTMPLFSLRRRIRVLAPQTTVYGQMTPQDAQPIIAGYPEVAFQWIPLASPPAPGVGLLRILGPEDVCNPANRMPLPPSPVVNASGFQTGDDILLTDVLSFEVRAAWFNNPNFNAITANSSPASRTMPQNTDEPFDDLPQSILNTTAGYYNQRVFDTFHRHPSFTDTEGDFWERPQTLNAGTRIGFLWNGANTYYQPPLRINVRSIQIKIRVWGTKSERARQMTMIQEI